MKTKEELTVLKEKFDTLNKKIAELSDEELAVVTGGLDSTLETLPMLKEKMINTVNGTNTDVDRKPVQKELDPSIAQIDDKALLTFNGKYLGNGKHI